MSRRALARLDIRLLGTLRVTVGSRSALHLPTRKVQALLAILALPPGRAHSREKLTTLLWGDASPPQARASFRQALATLRRALGARASALVATGDSVELDPGAVDVDAVRFERLVAQGSAAALEQAVELYRGELLEGLGVDDGDFDEWLLAERERLRELALQALGQLLDHQMKASAPEPAIRTAQRLLALDPLQEPVHRALMRLYVRQGRRASALRQYELSVATLARELKVAPEAETRRLYLEIVQQREAPGDEERLPDELAGWAAGEHTGSLLVGREAALAVARDALQRARLKGGRVLLVHGEAGIGKSRLVADLAGEAVRRGARVLFSRCRETEQILPLRPLIEAVRAGRVLSDAALVARLRADARLHLARLFPELRTAEPHGRAGTEDLAGLFEAIVEMVAALSARQPLVLVIEDLQWADEMTLRFISFAGRRLGSHATLLVGTARDEDLSAPALLEGVLDELASDGVLDRIALTPLAPAEVADLVRRLVPGGTPPERLERLAAQVQALSEGNPLVVVESVRTALERGGGDVGDDVPLPESVRRSIAARLERLPETARHLAGVAAVIGREFSFDLLRQAAGRGEHETAAGLEELVRRRIVEAVGDRFDFTHDRVQRVALEALLPSTRVVAHRAVAEALERTHAGSTEAVQDRLAHHWEQAGEADRAIAYLASCAETARTRFALDDAVRLLDRALAHVERLAPAERDRQILDLAMRKAHALSLGGRYAAARDLLLSHRERLERRGADDLAGRFWVRLGMAHSYLGAHADAEASARRALAAAERTGDALTLGLAHHLLGATAYWTAVPLEGVEHARRACELLARQRDPGEWLGLAECQLGVHLHMLGRFEPALAAFDRGRSLGQALGNARVQGLALLGRGAVLASQGAGERALDDTRG